MQFATAIMRLAVACLTSLLLFACAPVHTTPPADEAGNPASRVRLSAERLSPQAVRLTLDNGERHPIGYNLCTSGLQRRSGTTWAAVRTDDMCTMQLSTLNPGADATFQKSLPSNLQPGDYRYVTSVESPLGTPQRPVASNVFTLP